jgi:hypothetical protein
MNAASGGAYFDKRGRESGENAVSVFPVKVRDLVDPGFCPIACFWHIPGGWEINASRFPPHHGKIGVATIGRQEVVDVMGDSRASVTMAYIFRVRASGALQLPFLLRDARRCSVLSSTCTMTISSR